jgi:glucose-1-phosphate thymidylyltransferase
MYAGDNFLIGGVTEFVEEFIATPVDAQILLTKVDNPQQFGIAVLDDRGRVARLVEKPKEPPSDLALVGVYIFGPAIHQAVREIKPSWRNELEITDAIQWLIENDKSVRSHQVTGYWKDTGRLEDMLECNRKVLEGFETDIRGTVDAASRIIGRVVLEDGAVLERSTVRGPAIIGRDTVLRDSYVGPFTSIYHSCTIESTEIEYSIVLAQSTIRGVSRIEDSLIGKEVEVTPSRDQPRAHRLMLGDHSRVQLA